jgi:hypothetical protein
MTGMSWDFYWDLTKKSGDVTSKLKEIGTYPGHPLAGFQ